MTQPSENNSISPPNQFPWPPVLTVGMLALCWLLDRLVPIGWDKADMTKLMVGTGFAIIIIAFAVDIWSLMTFRKHSANIMPHRSATTLITTGPFAWSRNPIYLANVFLLVGVGLTLGSRWYLLGAAVLFFALQEMAIKHEERHLDALFPNQWNDYKKMVRRWI